MGPGGQAFGCGQCLPCRLNQRRVWTARIMLEAAQHEDNAFVTLTYRDEHLPADRSLHPETTRYFLDRLRKRVGYRSFRFFLCGEYGDLTSRPHYHLALFGYPCCEHGQTQRDMRGQPMADCCVPCATLSEVWGRGSVFVGGLEEDSAQYICGYVTKKMTRADDPRLNGRHPEFTRQSRNPGIGAGAAPEIASKMMQFNLDQRQADVPSALRFGRKLLPIGRYMKKKIREQIGREDTEPKESQLKRSAELLPLRNAARNSKEEPSFKKHLVASKAGKVASIEARFKIFNSGKDQL